MERSRTIDEIRKVLSVIITAFIITTLIPVALGLILSVPVPEVLGLISSTFLLQANAAFVGVWLGLNALFILLVMTLVEIGIVLGIYGILDAFAERSKRIRRLISSTERKMERYPILSRYGAVTLIFLPMLPVLDLYSSVIIGWLLRWNRIQSIFFVTLGWILVTGLLLLVAHGIIRLFF
ncbi:hypothetical protein DSECCO2_540340 [anaerobic digester metagenome]